MEVLIFLAVVLTVAVILIFPKRSTISGMNQPSYDAGELLKTEPLADEDEVNARIAAEMTEEEHTRLEAAQRLDQLTATRSGVMKLDLDGNGIIDSTELRFARNEIAEQIAAERAQAQADVAASSDESE